MMTPSDYQTLWSSCKITNEPKIFSILDSVCRTIFIWQERYLFVQYDTSIPWMVIAAIHYRESDQNFQRHLHNGDPLTERTTHIPKGRPVTGSPPFNWNYSAIDALSETWRPNAWTIPGCLEYLERYNGLGYQKHGVNSPYLWDYTDKYITGLFRSDGFFVPDLKESRAGCVAIFLALASKGVSLDFSSLPSKNPLAH